MDLESQSEMKNGGINPELASLSSNEANNSTGELGQKHLSKVFHLYSHDP